MKAGMFRVAARIGFLAVATLFAAGCRPDLDGLFVGVSNAGPEPLTDVRIEFAGGVVHCGEEPGLGGWGRFQPFHSFRIEPTEHGSLITLIFEDGGGKGRSSRIEIEYGPDWEGHVIAVVDATGSVTWEGSFHPPNGTKSEGGSTGDK